MPEKFYTCQIIEVKDGDTVVIVAKDVFFDSEFTARPIIRLFGIDAPEKAEGLAAKLHLARYVGKDLIMKAPKKDSFGRWLGTFYESLEGKSINQELLDMGLAKPYVRKKRE